MRKPVVLSWSGGKDSALALDALSHDPGVDVVGLLTSVTRNYDRISVGSLNQAGNIGVMAGAAVFTGDRPTVGSFISGMVPVIRTKQAAASVRQHCS